MWKKWRLTDLSHWFCWSQLVIRGVFLTVVQKSDACFLNWPTHTHTQTHTQSLLSKAVCGSCLQSNSWSWVSLWCYCRHFWEEICGHALNALDVKQVSVTISGNAESIGSYKESRLLLLKSVERWMVGWGRQDLGCILRSGYISLKYQWSAKIVHLMKWEFGTGNWGKAVVEVSKWVAQKSRKTMGSNWTLFLSGLLFLFSEENHAGWFTRWCLSITHLH